MVNSYAEVKGDQSVVRKRPAAQGGIAVGTGTAQGGIGLVINGTPYFIGFWADTMQTYTGGGTSWNSGTYYITGDHVSVDFVDYWAVPEDGTNINVNPTTSIYSASNPTGKWKRELVNKPNLGGYYFLLFNDVWYGDTPFYCPYPGGCVVQRYIYRNATAATMAQWGITPPTAGWLYDGTVSNYSGYGQYPVGGDGAWHAP